MILEGTLEQRGERLITVCLQMKLLDIFLCVFSLVIVAVIVPCAIVTWVQGDPFHWANYLCVAVSASAGYLIVELVLAMMFRPFRRSWLHPLSLLTFGFWQEGMISRHRKDVQAALERSLAQFAVSWDTVARQMTDLIPGLVEETNFEAKLVEGNENLLKTFKKDISGSVSKRVLATAGDVASFVREEMSRVLKQCLDDRESLSKFSQPLKQAIVSKMDWKGIEGKIQGKLEKIDVDSFVVRGCEKLEVETGDLVNNRILPDMRRTLALMPVQKIANRIVCKLGLPNRISCHLTTGNVKNLDSFVREVASAEMAFLRMIGFLIGALSGLISFVR